MRLGSQRGRDGGRRLWENEEDGWEEEEEGGEKEDLMRRKEKLGGVWQELWME